MKEALCIEISHLTRDYGQGKGVFDLSLKVEPGEIYGFLGPNGAGKTTTIRHLMGFLQAKEGWARIGGWDCFRERECIQENLGYLPGEIALMGELRGEEFLKLMAQMRGKRDFPRRKELMEYFELDASGKIRRMSKGMKQKLGLVCAFMHSPQVLVLDEPTSGLDPLMQQKFVHLLLEEKKQGRTILMSSHIFEEIERTCDRVAILKEGRLLAREEVKSIREKRERLFEIRFVNEGEARRFQSAVAESRPGGGGAEWVGVPVKGSVRALFQTLADYAVEDVNIREQSLEEMFLHYYGGE